MISDKRWIQRYENYKNALSHLSDAINNVHNPSDLKKKELFRGSSLLMNYLGK